MKAIAHFNPTINNGISGNVTFYQVNMYAPLQIVFDLKGFKSYCTHAIHIHEFGDLSQGCKSLGAHFNPLQRAHFHSELGHAGDLFNNFTTDRFGHFKFEYSTYKISLYGNLSILGRSIVIHKFPDDMGLRGINGVLYDDMTTEDLRRIVNILGYKTPSDRNSLLNKLNSESVTTGNASTRIAGSIIGIAS